MRSERLRHGQEVLDDQTYLRICRAVFAFRLLTVAMTSAFTPTTSTTSGVLLLLVASISCWAMLSDAFVRRYFRSPALAGLDVAIVTLLVAAEWPATLSLLVLALTMLVVGLTLTPWLGLPGLVMSIGLTLAYSTGSTTSPSDNRLAAAATISLPIALIGMTALGWTVRYAFVELQRTKDEVMATKLAQLELEERNRLARAMHDSLGKTVNGIGLAASALTGAASAGRLSDTAALSREIGKAADIAAQESRALLRGLRRHLDDRPIAERLGELARSRATESFSVRTDVRGIADLPRSLANEVVEISAEALENVVRHSGADSAQVRLARSETELVLEIVDRGVGIDRARLSDRERAGHFGIRGMSERAAATDGVCEISGSPGEGTRVTCRWPVDALTEGAIA
ncbi:sensor histidine kinase [Ornithinimicrobium sp. Y1694]|uniref:sensor histidine kinase n=1 Tax=Ornithinimicrobium sp. Y1694 TaxID=3418590 RepID=UPI003CEAAF66